MAGAKSIRLAGFAATGLGAIGVGLVGLATVALANPVPLLAGRWSGPGTISMSNGEVEQMRCVATYFIENNGGSVLRDLRPQSFGQEKVLQPTG